MHIMLHIFLHSLMNIIILRNIKRIVQDQFKQSSTVSRSIQTIFQCIKINSNNLPLYQDFSKPRAL